MVGGFFEPDVTLLRRARFAGLGNSPLPRPIPRPFPSPFQFPSPSHFPFPSPFPKFQDLRNLFGEKKVRGAFLLDLVYFAE